MDGAATDSAGSTRRELRRANRPLALHLGSPADPHGRPFTLAHSPPGDTRSAAPRCASHAPLLGARRSLGDGGAGRRSVPLPLTHHMLGRIIRAQRPSVTAALKQLREHGFLTRGPDGTWVIHGDPAEQLRELAGDCR